MSVRLDFCSRQAATFAVKAWHYSRAMPSGRLVCVGAWEDGAFIGAVIFGRGASSQIHSPYNLQQSEVVELCRVALSPHVTPTSRIVALAVRLLRKQSPDLRLLISFSDPMQCGPSGRPHDGTLYRAMGWWLIGMTHAESRIQLGGTLYHARTISSRYHTRAISWLQRHVAADAQHVRQAPKFRYCLPLDAQMQRQLESRRLPYPKGVSFQGDRSTGGGARGPQAGEVTPSTSATDTTREGTFRHDPVAPVAPLVQGAR